MEEKNNSSDINAAYQNGMNAAYQNGVNALEMHIQASAEDSPEALMQKLETETRERFAALEKRIEKVETFVRRLFHPSEWFAGE